MGRHKYSRPTDRELTILQILWDNGPSTVRQVNEAMNKDEDTGYTTTLKLMQIMTEKGLLPAHSEGGELDKYFQELVDAYMPIMTEAGLLKE